MARPRSEARRGAPSREPASTSLSRCSRLGCGARAGASSGRRKTPTRRRISASACAAPSARRRRAPRAPSPGRAAAAGERRDAWTVMTLTCGRRCRAAHGRSARVPRRRLRARSSRSPPAASPARAPRRPHRACVAANPMTERIRTAGRRCRTRRPRLGVVPAHDGDGRHDNRQPGDPLEPVLQHARTGTRWRGSRGRGRTRTESRPSKNETDARDDEDERRRGERPPPAGEERQRHHQGRMGSTPERRVRTARRGPLRRCDEHLRDAAGRRRPRSGVEDVAPDVGPERWTRLMRPR